MILRRRERARFGCGGFERVARNGLAAVHPDIVAANFHRKAGHRDSGIKGSLAGADVILPAVPGAGDHFALQLAFAQRSAAMQAGVVNGVESSADVRDSQGRAVDLKLSLIHI